MLARVMMVVFVVVVIVAGGVVGTLTRGGDAYASERHRTDECRRGCGSLQHFLPPG
jgi:archaellum component FlaG (FlaF/FlaG flagellin family)